MTTADLDTFVSSFCERHEINTFPKIKDCYDFHIGDIHTKLVEYADKIVFLSELAVGIEEEEASGQLLINQFIVRNSQHMNKIADTVVYENKTHTVYLQRIVNIETLDDMQFEDALFEHMDNTELYNDIF